MFKFCALTDIYLFIINMQVVDNHESCDYVKFHDPIVFKCDEGYDDAINGAYGIANDALYYGTKSMQFFKVFCNNFRIF